MTDTAQPADAAPRAERATFNLWLHTLAARPVTTALLFGFLALVWFTVGNTGSLWDRDEPRYATASRIMLESGDYIVPMDNGSPRLKKPPLTYWLQAGAMTAIARNEFAARLPSALAAALTFLLVIAFARRYGGKDEATRLRSAMWAGILFLGNFMVAIQGRSATTDAVLMLGTTLLIFGWFDLVLAPANAPRRTRWRWAVWFLAGAAVLLTKGPVGPAVLVATIVPHFIWWRFAKAKAARASAAADDTEEDLALRPVWLKPMRLLPLILAAAAACVPLAAWVWAMEDRGISFAKVFFGQEVGERALIAQEGHTGPFFYYIVVLLGSFLPWLALLTIAWRHWREAGPRMVRAFLLFAVIGPVVLFSIPATKLPHYILPVYPMLAVLGGMVLARATSATTTTREDGFAPVGVWRAGAILLIVLGVALPLALPTVGLLRDAMRPSLPSFWPAMAWLLPGVLVLAIGWIAGGVSLWKGRYADAARRVGTAMIVGLMMLATMLPSAFERYKPARDIGATARRAWLGSDIPTLVVYGWDEPSLSFYTGWLKEKISRADVADIQTLAESSNRDWLLLVRQEDLQAKASPEVIAAFEALPLLGRWEGFHYNASDNRLTLELRGPHGVEFPQTLPAVEEP